MWSSEPTSTLKPLACDECDNEIEGICSTCGAYVCGSCFNGNHEYKVHGPSSRPLHRGACSVPAHQPHTHAYHSDDNRCVVCGVLKPELRQATVPPSDLQ